MTDTVTGLIWLQLANCVPNADWAAANFAAAGLQDDDCTLTDGSSPGDWRSPTRDEWAVTIARAVALGCTLPALTNDAGTGCYNAGGSSFASVASGDYWSSTAHELFPSVAWFRRLDNGIVGDNKFRTLRVWPVRSPHPH